MNYNAKTARFMAELSTAMEIQQFANKRGIVIDIEKSHEAWTEHSDVYCAGWLVWRDEDHTIEILQALTKWQERHGKLPVLPRVENRALDGHAAIIAAMAAPDQKTHEQKLAELREAAAAEKADRETVFARIDEAVATHRAISPSNPDHPRRREA